jgi:hypothetical protein
VNQHPVLSQCFTRSLYNGQFFCELGGAASRKFPFLLFNGQESAVCCVCRKDFFIELAVCFPPPHCVGSEKRQKGQSLRKNFSMLAVGAGFSSGDFKTLRGDRACKALSLGEVAAAVRLRIAGFGEGTPQQDSDGTERAKCEIWHHGRILLSAAPNLPSLYNGHFFGKKQGMYL